MKSMKLKKWLIFIMTITGIILSFGVAFGILPIVYFNLIPIFWALPAGISGGYALADIMYE